MFIPPPGITEQTLPDQTGRAHLVIGGYSGVEQELAKILYAKNATIYRAGRSEEKALKRIQAVKGASFPDSGGDLSYLYLDLSNLSTIKRAADEFLDKECRLDVLTNNAGIMMPPTGSRRAWVRASNEGKLLRPVSPYYAFVANIEKDCSFLSKWG